MRVYDSALEINSDSFAKEKAAGYEVKLNAAVLRPIDGAEDKDGEITRGHNGYVNINAEVTKNSKAVGTVSFAQKITAGVKTAYRPKVISRGGFLCLEYRLRQILKLL